jgi:hypothetical protein
MWWRVRLFDDWPRIMAAVVSTSLTFGVTAQTGMYIESFEADCSAQEKWVMDADGDEVAGSIYGGAATWSMQGAYKVGETLSQTLGASITLANAFTWADFFTGYSSGGSTYVLGAKPSRKVDDFKMVDLSGGFKPFGSLA